MTFDAAAFGPITLDHLPPFAQRLREAANLVWEEGYRQPFLRELGNGTLDRERFAFYLLQDYRYLNDYAKVHALALTKPRIPKSCGSWLTCRTVSSMWSPRCTANTWQATASASRK